MKHTSKKFKALLGGGSTLLLLFTLNGYAAAQAFFTGLGDLPGGGFFSRADDVSADGSTVVGLGVQALGAEAFRWTAAEGMVGLGELPGGAFFSRAEGVSANGSVVVGTTQEDPTGVDAFRWTTATGMVNLGHLPGGFWSSEAHDVSADGSVVVGQSDGSGFREAFRWTTATGMVGLGCLPPGTLVCEARAVSADGSVVVGTSSPGEAFRWTAATGMVSLGELPGGGHFSVAFGVSADGSTVVGQGASTSGNEAFRWTAATGMVGLGDLPGGGFFSRASDVSADVSIVVGTSSSASGNKAFVWDATNGMRDLQAVLATEFGLSSSLTGWTLTEATAVSDDGLTFVGFGINPQGATEAWIARITPPLTEVAIDIKPGSFPNSINPKSKGKIPVAILTTDTFDATTVDPSTVLFGATGTEATPVQSALEDVDGDGDADMILHFNTQDTGIVCGDTSASLTGETFSGQPIEGSDPITTVECK